MITVGILAAFLVALVILWVLPGSARTLDWRLILGIGAVPALTGVALRTQMPESPRWLLRHIRFEGAKSALAKLGFGASMDDIKFTASQLHAADARADRERRRIWSPGVGGYAGMCAAAILAAAGLLGLHGTARIIVVMITLNAFVASFSIGVGGTGWLIHQFLPETKNRSVEEITELFERQAAGDRRAGMTSRRDADAAAA
jgi:hypothetical protein